ncbi:MAG: hypothetical protein WDN47_01520 [Candidatus Doudnabacteria bacterium]
MLNNKITWIFLLLVLLPNIVFWGSPVLENYFKGFYVTDYNGFFFTILFIPIIGSIFMFWVSVKHKNDWAKATSAVLFLIALLMFFFVKGMSSLSIG